MDDFLVLFGLVLAGMGLFWIYPPLMLVYLGLLIALVGLFRIWGRQ